MRVIDGNEALTVLGEVVREKGEGYVYGADGTDTAGYSCMNWLCLGEGEPRSAMCIAGRVYDRLGVLDKVGGAAIVHSVALELEERGILKFTESAKLVLRTAQVMQDGGHTWGVALASASAALQAYQQARL